MDGHMTYLEPAFDRIKAPGTLDLFLRRISDADVSAAVIVDIPVGF